MSLNQPVLGEGFVPAYQISPTPYLTQSVLPASTIHTHSFDYATRNLTITNIGAATDVIAVAFTSNGFKPTNANFYSLAQNRSLQIEVRTSKLFISASVGNNITYQFVAGLTSIPIKNFLTITGSNGFPGVG